jgi:uncharacterized membrane protein YjgN (DUF898 family)
MVAVEKSPLLTVIVASVVFALVFSLVFRAASFNSPIVPVLVVLLVFVGLMLAAALSFMQWLHWQRMRRKYQAVTSPGDWQEFNWIVFDGGSSFDVRVASNVTGIHIAPSFRPDDTRLSSQLASFLRRLLYQPLFIPWAAVTMIRWQGDHMAIELVDSNVIMSLSTKVFEDGLLYLPPGGAVDESTYKDSL